MSESEFDDLVEDDEEESTEGHSPKKPQGGSNGQETPQPSSKRGESGSETSDAEDGSVENQSKKISDSTPMGWEREQFAMFFQEDDVFGYEDIIYDAEGCLKRQHRVRNSKRYELDQAFIDLVLDRVSSEEIADQVIKNRGFDI
jgi:hypothetical protein